MVQNTEIDRKSRTQRNYAHTTLCYVYKHVYACVIIGHFNRSCYLFIFVNKNSLDNRRSILLFSQMCIHTELMITVQMVCHISIPTVCCNQNLSVPMVLWLTTPCVLSEFYNRRIFLCVQQTKIQISRHQTDKFHDNMSISWIDKPEIKTKKHHKKIKHILWRTTHWFDTYPFMQRKN